MSRASLPARCVAACEAFGQHIGPANGIEKMERERPAAGASATWYKPFPASLGKYLGSKGPGFLEMPWHATARPLSDDACMAVVPHDDLPYLMKAICLFFCSLLSVIHPVCAMHAIVRVRYIVGSQGVRNKDSVSDSCPHQKTAGCQEQLCSACHLMMCAEDFE